MEPKEQHILELQTVSGFIKLYYQLIHEYSTYEQAYDAAERQYKAAFYKNRYSGYDSFRNVLSRYNKAKTKKDAAHK